MDSSEDVIASLAKDASVLFRSEKFAECVKMLKRLLQKKEDDPQILHNIAVAEFVRDGCSDPKKLLEDLIRIKRKIEGIAASRAEIKAICQADINSPVHEGSIFLANIGGVVILNIATILFQLHEYPKALSVLEPLFQNIEPIEETTALHVCLLLLDLAFLTRDAPKISDVTTYLGKAFGLVPNQAVSKISSNSNSSVGVISNLSSSLKLQSPLSKIQLLLLTGNLKAARREIKLTMKIARGVNSSKILLLKSQLEYASGNYPKVLKLLKASTKQADAGSSVIIDNNEGCIFYQQGKHNLSAIFFRKSLNNSSSLSKEKPRKLGSFSQDKSLLISYNCGVQHLSCGNPTLAAKCFLKASLVFNNRPLLWVRLAECCLVASEKGILRDTEPSTCESGLNIQVIGQGKWRHAALENNWKGNVALHSNDKPKLSMSYARQCLFNALYLLGNSKEQYKAEDSTSSHKSGPENSSSNDLKSNGGSDTNQASANAISENKDICRKKTENIKQTVLVDLAFVELELGNPLKALTTSLSLLELPECSRMHAFLGHVYAAEALCLLNRPKEAVGHLSTYLSAEQNVEIPYTEEDCRQWKMKKGAMNDKDSNPEEDNLFLSPEEARVALYVNLASMHAIQGELERALFFATRALGTAPKNQDALVMGVYLDLKLGNTKEALAKLKQCHRVKFCPIISRLKDAS